MDKCKVVFLADALEAADVNSPDFHEHDIFTPNMYTKRREGETSFYKIVGSVVIAHEHVKSIKLDGKA